MTITADYLREHLAYDEETGDFRWLKSGPGRSLIGVAGSINAKGYRVIGIGRRTYRAHRLAWLFVHGVWPSKHLDHRNEIKTDNRISNLREATNSQNKCNRGAQSNNNSGFKGVSYFKKTGRWEAYITLHRKRRHLGYFDTAEQAHAAYVSKSAEIHGEFAKTCTGASSQ